MAGLLASLDLHAFSFASANNGPVEANLYPGLDRDGVTVAGTAPVSHRIPF
ncbi:hypothetical protein CLV48_10222 [Cecembia rubra]|uniref:Uncharacterized protein n=1 Tax=Cecembia rubra TaxID=1485585 RepID=A0A2P8E9S5_9BACT|nr:hypothetical protein CLV48_10222 [Cecembia rubra]